MTLEEVEAACGYVFKDKKLLEKALTLSSHGGDFNNESLECLGDSLLGFIVAEKYYEERLKEGQITEKKQQLLSDEALRPVSVGLGLDRALITGKGDFNNKKAVPSAYEALTAAIYLDGGLAAAKRFALSTLRPIPHSFNCIGALQELLQADGEPLPQYVMRSVGTAKKPKFKVSVTVRGRTFNAEAGNIAEARRAAAHLAYDYCVGNGK